MEQSNTLNLWKKDLPSYQEDIHKYDRGHAVVFGGGEESTGAARMAAKAALRMGIGLVTVASPPEALPIYATSLETVMVRNVIDARIKEFLLDERKNAVLIGPGSGVEARTKKAVLAALELKKSCVLDADALSVFEDNPFTLFDAIDSPVILTPHQAEFERIFDISARSNAAKAQEAAKISGAVVVLKGHETAIASPSGEVIINHNAPNYLATAGSGDVLAGITLGLLAQKMTPFKAACAAVWMHGELGNMAGRGLVADELEQYIPAVLGEIYE